MSFVPKYRHYQDTAIKDLFKIYDSHPTDLRALLELPPAGGKTYTAQKFIFEYFAKKTNVRIVWTAPEKTLIWQSYCDLLVYLGKKIPKDEVDGPHIVKSNGITFEFTTWQRLSGPKSKHKTFDLLVIDEVHHGSAKYGKKANEHVSFQTIFKVAPMHLYISATALELCPKLFNTMMVNVTKRCGKTVKAFSQKRRATYPTRTAIQEGFLCNVQFCVVRTPDTLVLQELEKKFTVYHETKDEQVEFVVENKVNLKDKRSMVALQKAELNSLLNVWIQKEMRKDGSMPPSMIFTVPRKAESENLLSIANVVKSVRDAIREELKRRGIKQTRTCDKLVRSISGENSESGQNLADFKEGEFPILVTCNMASAGFNYPALECLIDFNHRPKNIRKWLQKMGRLMRLYTGKSHGRCYYADRIDNEFTINNAKHELNDKANAAIQDALSAVVGEDEKGDFDAAKSAIVGIMKAHDDISDEKGGEAQLDSQEQFNVGEGKKKQIVTVTSVNMFVTNAYNKKDSRNLSSKMMVDNLQICQSDGINWDYHTSKPSYEEDRAKFFGKGIKFWEVK